MKDVGAAAFTETLPLIAGIGAGIASVKTGPAAPFVASGVSNLAYSGVGAMQDVGFRKMAGLPAGVGQVASERGKEAALGLGIDLLTYGAAKPFTKRAGTAIENNVAKELREATELLQKKRNGCYLSSWSRRWRYWFEVSTGTRRQVSKYGSSSNHGENPWCNG